MLTLGWYVVHSGRVASHPERLSEMVRLITDPRWDTRFRLIDVRQTQESAITPLFKGAVSRAKFAAAAEHALGAPDTHGVVFGVSRDDDGDVARLYVEPGQHPGAEGIAPFTSFAVWAAPRNPTTVAGWCELVHALTELLAAEHGIVAVSNTEVPSDFERWLSNVSERAKLGAHVRPPQWGTYLNASHVSAVGGRERIIATVRPAVVRVVGNLLYVQLSDRIEDAFRPMAEERRRAFTELLAPLTVTHFAPAPEPVTSMAMDPARVARYQALSQIVDIDVLHAEIVRNGIEILDQGVPYLLRLARWRNLDQHRRGSRHISLDEPKLPPLFAEVQDTFDRLAEREDSRRLLQALMSLPDGEMIVVWRHVEGIPDASIAEELGLLEGTPPISEAGVRQRRARALHKLRARLEEDDK